MEAPSNARKRLRFGLFQVDLFSGELYKNGIKVHLQDKPFRILSLLLERPGEVVTREELKRTLWSLESQVNHDANLNTTINKLRRALGESTDKVSYIETIPRKGYRFIGTAEFSDIPFVEKKPANSARSVTVVLDREQEARARDVLLSGKSLAVLMVTVFLTGILLGATAATFWLSRDAS